MQFSKEIRTYDAGGAADLLCPRCGADNLHHVGVTFFERGEDDGAVLRITQSLRLYATERATSTETEIVAAEKSGNPSMRRSGMAIEFYCEQCGGAEDGKRLELTIGQHKGCTEIGWRFDPKSK